MNGGAAIAMPLRVETGASGLTTLLVDARGIAIGCCYGELHREHADIIVGVMNMVLDGPPPSQRDRLQ